MPISKNTQSRAREWVQCNVNDFRITLNRMCDAGILFNLNSTGNVDGTGSNIYSDGRNLKILAKHYRYAKSEQCMIHVSMQEYMPEQRHINTTEASIYDGISQVRL